MARKIKYVECVVCPALIDVRRAALPRYEGMCPSCFKRPAMGQALPETLTAERRRHANIDLRAIWRDERGCAL